MGSDKMSISDFAGEYQTKMFSGKGLDFSETDPEFNEFSVILLLMRL